MSIDLETMVNVWMFCRSGFKAFVKTQKEILITLYYQNEEMMELRNFKSNFLLIFLILFSMPLIEASAHSLFNSGESTIGDYRVQIATLPEIPDNGKPMQILFRVTDLDLNEVDRFTMGARIFYMDQQIDTIPPSSHQGGHWEFDYILENSGNHIFRVDLYDAKEDGGIITYTFNISTQNPFGYFFFFSIAAGSIGLSAIIAYIYIPKLIRARTKS